MLSALCNRVLTAMDTECQALRRGGEEMPVIPRNSLLEKDMLYGESITQPPCAFKRAYIYSLLIELIFFVIFLLSSVPLPSRRFSRTCPFILEDGQLHVPFLVPETWNSIGTLAFVVQSLLEVRRGDVGEKEGGGGTGRAGVSG